MKKRGRSVTEFSENFWSRLIREESGCWIWQGSKINKGYGNLRVSDDVMAQFGLTARYQLAHRVAFALAGGRLDPSLTVDHKCHRKLCCNPAHLSQISNAENTRRKWYHRFPLNPNTGEPPCLGAHSHKQKAPASEQARGISSPPDMENGGSECSQFTVSLT